MIKATSYICEHTAEFVLIPALKEILCKRFEFVTPIFPWIRREGSNISRGVHSLDKFKILGLYPRRPKLTSVVCKNIIVKVNEQILLSAQSGRKFGIPIIAGCPLATNFCELGKTPNCLWIRLDQDLKEDFEIELEQEKSSYTIKLFSEYTFQNDENLLTYIDKNSKLLDLDSTLRAFRLIKINKGC